MKNSNNLAAGLIKLIGSLKHKKMRDDNSIFLVEGINSVMNFTKANIKLSFWFLKMKLPKKH